jgi:ankyrin repeat protein
VATEIKAMLDYLVNAGVDINSMDNNGNTPLHIAAMDGTSDGVVEYLFKLRVDPSAQNNLGATPLHLALPRSRCAPEGLAQGESGADLERVGMNALSQDTSPILQDVFALIAAGSDLAALTIDGDSLMHSAVASKDHHLVKFMLAQDTPVDHANKDGVTPLFLAAYIAFREPKITSMLLDAGARLDPSSELSPLVACLGGIKQHDKAEVVPVLLDAGADIMFRDSDGFSVLYWAVCMHNPSALRLLLPLYNLNWLIMQLSNVEWAELSAPEYSSDDSVPLLLQRSVLVLLRAIVHVKHSLIIGQEVEDPADVPYPAVVFAQLAWGMDVEDTLFSVERCQRYMQGIHGK